MGVIILTRKGARAIVDNMPEDTPETGDFFKQLMEELDNEQGADEDDREGITIEVTGSAM